MVKIAGTPTNIIGTATKIYECCCEEPIQDCPTCSSDIITGTSHVISNLLSYSYCEYTDFFGVVRRYAVKLMDSLNGTYTYSTSYNASENRCEISPAWRYIGDFRVLDQFYDGTDWQDGTVQQEGNVFLYAFGLVATGFIPGTSTVSGIPYTGPASGGFIPLDPPDYWPTVDATIFQSDHAGSAFFDAGPPVTSSDCSASAVLRDRTASGKCNAQILSQQNGASLVSSYSV